MRVYRDGFTNSKGKRKSTARYYLDFSDDRGTRQRFPAFTDKAASEALGRTVVRLVACRSASMPLDLELTRAVEVLPFETREKLLEIGLLERTRAAGTRPLVALAAEYEASLRARGGTAKHARTQARRAVRVFEGCGFRFWTDIQPLAVESHLRALREGENGLGHVASNALLGAVRSFCRWMVTNARASEDPLRGLRPLNARVDVRRPRRALSAVDLRTLLDTTASAPASHGMSGTERALVYRLALESGLRASELRSLRVLSFELDGTAPTVRVQAGYSKRRREDVQPLRLDTANALRAFLANRMPTAPAFGIPVAWRSAEMLREDLERAGLAYRDDEGRVADFHALRHSFITSLATGGVSPKVAQSLARHSTITLTLDRYTHLRPEDDRRALDLLPNLEPRHPTAVGSRATGTDGATDRSAIDSATLHGRRATAGDFMRDAIGCGSDPLIVSPIVATSLRPEGSDSTSAQPREERSGDRGRARTYDLMIKSHLLYRLSYAATTGAERMRTGRERVKRGRWNPQLLAPAQHQLARRCVRHFPEARDRDARARPSELPTADPVGGCKGGERGRDRTVDLLVKSQLLYRLSYAPFVLRAVRG